MKTEAMSRRFDRHLPNDGRSTISLQKKLVETERLRQQNKNPKIPDLTDFMNDMFFGTIKIDDNKKTYNLTGGDRHDLGSRDEDDFDSSTRSNSSRQTHEWLEEAKRVVASSPSRGPPCDSSTRLVSSPRFGISQGRFSTSSLDKRDPLSRSARRHRGMERFSGEILSKTAIHTRNGSDTNLDPLQTEPLYPVQKWVSNNIKIPQSPDPILSPDRTPPSPTSRLAAPPLPPRQSIHRRSRFKTDPNAPLSHDPNPNNPPAISTPKRNFKTTTTTSKNNNAILDTELLSPPKNLVESAHRRSMSSNTCSVLEDTGFSPPWNLVELAHRRSVSQSMGRNDRIIWKDNNFVHDGQLKRDKLDRGDLNGFLKEQRVKIDKLLNGEINGKTKIVLSGPSNSTSSMVAAICYALLLENRMQGDLEGGQRNGNNLEFVVPVMNIRRGKMWKQRQAAWLFHHVGIDATSLLFSNEVDLETLMMSKQLSMFIVGEDILITNAEVGSVCTILTDNYCEDAYDLLQTPILKKLLLAGILLDTENLNGTSPKSSMTRDVEAVQLLSVAYAPNYRNKLFNQLMQDQRDNNFFEVLRDAYGKPPSEINWGNGTITENRVSEKNGSNEVIPPVTPPIDDNKKQNDIIGARTKKFSPIPGKYTPSPLHAPSKAAARTTDASRGKNKNFFAKLFGFGSK